MIHIYDTETAGHLLTSEQLPHAMLKDGQQMQIDVRTNDHVVQYVYYVNAIEVQPTYVMAYVSLQKVYVDGTIVSVP